MICCTASAQKNWVASVDYEHELTFYRPRIALASDGSHAIAWETYRKLTDSEEWQVGIQRFDGTGHPVNEVSYVRGDGGCSEEGVDGGVQNVALRFDSRGELIIAMEPVIDGYDMNAFEQPRTIITTLDGYGTSRMNSAVFPCRPRVKPGSIVIESERPRIDIVPGTDKMLVVGSVMGAVAALPLGEYEEGILWRQTSRPTAPVRPVGMPHQYYDAWHDVATNGERAIVSWHRCPVINDMGDADECDVLVGFSTIGENGEMTSSLSPFKVNRGDASGILNYRPAVAMNEKGESVVVWVDYRSSEAGEIWAQRFDAAGWPQGRNLRISNGEGEIVDFDGIGPEVALLDDGQFMVVWTDRQASGMRALGRIVNPDGAPDGPPFLLEEDSELESGFADVASDGSLFGYTWLTYHEGGAAIYYSIPGSGIEKDDAPLPVTSFLFSSFPNPFSDKTTLKYVLLEEGQVTLVIYDLLGREVKRLVDMWQAPGSYVVDVPAGELATGYYITKLQQGNRQDSRVLIRTR